jgi:hypothetical protein
MSMAPKELDSTAHLQLIVARLRSSFRWLWNVVRDPALYVIAFTFYAGMHPRLTLVQLALCYAGTVLVMVIRETWRTRLSGPSDLAADIGSAVLWGSFLFIVGVAWGASCGYILMWMGR